MNYRFVSVSPEETRSFGKRLSAILQGGDVITLKGDLGAGKTALTQGIGEGLGIIEILSSPTFTIIQEYSISIGKQLIRFLHMDLYRLQHPEEAEIIGIPEAFQEDNLCIIEWPDVANDFLPDDFLQIEINYLGDSEREIILHPTSHEWENRLVDLQF